MHRRRAPVSVPRRGERGGRRSRAVLIIQPRTIANDASSPKRSRREGGGEAGGRCVTSTPCPDVLQPRAPPQGSGTDGPSGCRSPAAPRLARGRAPGEGPPRWGRGWDVRSARINRGPRAGARRHRRRTPQSAAITARGRRRCQRALLLPGGGGSGAGVLQALRAARPCPACPGLSPWGRARSWAPGTKAPPDPAARTWSEPAPAWPHPSFCLWPRPPPLTTPPCPSRSVLPRSPLAPPRAHPRQWEPRQDAAPPISAREERARHAFTVPMEMRDAAMQHGARRGPETPQGWGQDTTGVVGSSLGSRALGVQNRGHMGARRLPEGLGRGTHHGVHPSRSSAPTQGGSDRPRRSCGPRGWTPAWDPAAG